MKRVACTCLLVLCSPAVAQASRGAEVQTERFNVASGEATRWTSRRSYPSDVVIWVVRVNGQRVRLKERISRCRINYYARAVAIRVGTCDDRLRLRIVNAQPSAVRVKLRFSGS